MDSQIVNVTPCPRLAGKRGIEPGNLGSGYARFWLPILGPTSSLAYQRLLDATDRGTHDAVVSIYDLAADVGVGCKGGKHSPINRAIQRLYRFGIVAVEVTDRPTLALSPLLRPLTNAQLDRLRPEVVRAERQFRQAIANVVPIRR